MNSGLTRWQVEDILAASEDVDVSAAQMLRAAEDIRAALLGPAEDSWNPASEAVSPICLPRRVRRARVRVTAVCAAAMSLAVLLGAATTGALPSALQDPVATLAGLVGIDLPRPEPKTDSDTTAVRTARPAEGDSGSRSNESATRGSSTADQSTADPKGGNNPNAGGNNPNAGGNNPNAGGNNPNAGGNNPNAGGNNPNAGGNNPNAGGNNPNAGGNNPNAGGNNPNAGGNNPNAGGNNPNAGGNNPNAGGNNPNAGGNNPNAGGNNPNAGGGATGG